jgi:translocation and assembly module TamB
MKSAGQLRRLGWWKLLLIAVAVVVAVFAALTWYASTNSFQNMVRRRMVAELERAFGGRVELGSIHTTPFRMRIEVRDVSIHGEEASGEAPYVHVDRIVAEAKVISVLGLELGFRSLVLDHPTVHVIASSSGWTNVPGERSFSATKADAIRRLFAVSVNRLEVRHGTLLWNNRSTPLDFTARDVSLDMDYSLLYRRYEGELLIGKADTKLQNDRPFAWMAQAHFALSRSHLELQSLTLRSGNSEVQASGRVDDFEQPRIQLTYSAKIDLAEAAAIVREPMVEAGTLQVDGRGSWTETEFSAAGKAMLRNFSGRYEGVPIRDMDLSSAFSLTSERLTLSGIRGHVFGGTVGGDADIANWLPVNDRPVQFPKAKLTEQQGKLHLTWKDVTINTLPRMLNGQFRTLAEMNFAGAATGSLDSHWNGSFRRSETDLNVDVTAPRRISPGQRPLNAHLRGTYRGAADELQLAQFDASTPEIQVHASGRLAADATLKFSAQTTNLTDFQPILTFLGYPKIPAVLHGPAIFTGTATGGLSSASFIGNVHAQDFDLLPAGASSVSKPVHIDSFTAQLRLSPHGISINNATLRRDDMAVNFDASSVLRNGELTRLSPFTLRMDMRHVSAAEFFAVTGYQFPVSGTVNLHIHASGTRASPDAEGHIEITDGTIGEYAVQHFDSDLRYLDSEAALSGISLIAGQAEVTGNARYNFSSHSVQLDLKGTNFDLRSIPALQTSRLALNGSADFVLHGAGTKETPIIQASAQLHNFSFNQYRVGTFVLTAATHGADLHLTGHSQFKQGSLMVNGDVRVSGDWPANLDLTFSNLDLDPVLHSYIRDHFPAYSAASGGMHLHGPLRRLHEINLIGNLSALSFGVDKLKTRNRGDIQFSLSSGHFRVTQLHMVGTGTDLSATGDVQLDGQHDLQLHAQGSANLGLIQTFNPDFTSSGGVTADLSVSGPLAQPVVHGRIDVKNGSIAYIDLPSALSGINGSLVFNQHQLQIESLAAQVGGGKVAFTGNANLYQNQLRFDLGMVGHDVRLRYPPGVSSTADLKLRYAGTPAESLLSGDITISKLAITPGFDFADYLASSQQTNPLPQTNPLLNRIHMDVHVTTTPELQMQTAAVRLSGDADLHLRGTAARPALLGRADILEGEVYFGGTKYRLERGDVIFVNPATIQPVVDLEATTQIRDYEITLDVNGQAGRPLNITYRSEPPLPPADIITLLALGRTQSESAQLQNQTPLTQQASNAILAQALNAAVSSRAQRLFGNSRVKIDPVGLSTETSIARGPAITIQQQVAGNITLTYSTNINQTSQQVIQGEYNISRNISLVAIRDQNGVVSFDIRIRHRKK